MVYAATSTGYLSGGTVNGTPFQPEEVTNYEIGVKSDLFDRRLRLNGALFHQIYKNLQFTIFPAGSALLLNAGRSRINGAELELTAVPVDGLTLTAGLGYTDFKYTRLDPVIGDPDTFTVFYRPKWTANVGANYVLPRFNDSYELSFGVDGQAHAKYFTVTDLALRDQAISPETWVWNARATLSDIALGTTTARVQAWVKNLTNEDEITFAGAVGPSVAAFYRPARTYGVDLSLKF
jgi:iron complex outermembrane receptor protein